MKITTKDESGGMVTANVDDNRVAMFSNFFTKNPEILGMGAWGPYGRGAQDATEAQAFAVSQLAYVEQKVYARQYQPLKYEDLLGNTISYAAGEGAQSIEYQIVDYAGVGRRLSPSADDMPFADVASARKAIPVANGGIGYFYTTEDLRISAYLKRPLPEEKQRAAIMGFRRHMNLVALQGEAGSNFFGLFNNPNVTAANRPSGAVWDAATPDTIITDFIAGITAVKVATKDNSMPVKVVLPISTFGTLLKARATSSDVTVLEFLSRIYPGITISSADELNGLGAGGTKRVVFFNPDDDNMVFHIPMAQRFLAPQMNNLRVKIPGEYKYAGLEIRRPSTVYYMDGV